MLYIVRFLHQTTTVSQICQCDERCISSVSYIKPQPSISTNFICSRCISSVSYIKPQLLANGYIDELSCISSVSYIKPQLMNASSSTMKVVYRPFPTSNHNQPLAPIFSHTLYIVRFLHQTTTYSSVLTVGLWLYIVRFLHQTTTVLLSRMTRK